MINIKDFENGVNKVTSQLLPRGHVHCSRKLVCQKQHEKTFGHFIFADGISPQIQPSIAVTTTLTLANGARGKIIHLHGDGKVLKVVEKLEEGSKLIKGDSLKCHKTHTSSNIVTEK